MSDKVTKRVGDVAPAFQPFEGEKVTVRDLIDKEFVVTRIVKLVGDEQDYLGVQIQSGVWEGFFFSSHAVIARKLVACIDALPLLAKITLVEPGEGRNSYFNIE